MRGAKAMMVLGIMLVLVVGGCGGARFDGTVYQDQEIRFQVGTPGDGWERAQLDDQNDLAWVNRELGAVIQVNGSCDPALDIPLESLTRHLLIGFTELDVMTRDRLSIDGREGLRTEVAAKLDGVARQLALLVVKKDGCVYDFSLISRPGSSGGAEADAYNRVVEGFRALRPGPVAWRPRNRGNPCLAARSRSDWVRT